MIFIPEEFTTFSKRRGKKPDSEIRSENKTNEKTKTIKKKIYQAGFFVQERKEKPK